MSSSSTVRRLSDDELEYAAAGTGNIGQANKTVKAYCPKCRKITDVRLFSGGRGHCVICNTEIDNL